MKKNNSSEIFFAKTLEDVLYHMHNISGLQIVSGCTDILPIPQRVLCISGVSELSSIDKHERYTDYGPGVTLSQMILSGEKKMPSVLSEALSTIATPLVRNIATLGGNICAKGIKHTLYAPLLALEAKLEFQTQTEILSIPFTKFIDIPAGFTLTKIRIPQEDWEVAVFRRVGPAHLVNSTTSSFTYLADTQKSILTNVRIAFAGPVTFRCTELENRLLGMKLPLNDKTIQSFIETAKKQYDTINTDSQVNPILREQFLNLTRYSLYQQT